MSHLALKKLDNLIVLKVLSDCANRIKGTLVDTPLIVDFENKGE